MGFLKAFLLGQDGRTGIIGHSMTGQFFLTLKPMLRFSGQHILLSLRIAQKIRTDFIHFVCLHQSTLRHYTFFIKGTSFFSCRPSAGSESFTTLTILQETCMQYTCDAPQIV